MSEKKIGHELQDLQGSIDNNLTTILLSEY